MAKGDYMRGAFEELKKAGGICPIDSIKEILRKGEESNVLSRDEVMRRCENYFLSCTRVIRNEETGAQEVLWARNPTKSGLSLALGVSPETLIDYVAGKNSVGNPFSEANPNSRRIISNADFDIVRRAYTLICEFYESKLGNNQNPAGSIFWLNNSKNRVWSNEQEVKVRPEFLDSKKEKPIVSTDFALKMLLESREEEEREEKEEDDEENNDISAGT